MTELKTLKDFTLDDMNDFEDFEDGIIRVKDLKEGAIKWVKAIRNVWGEGLAVEKTDKVMMDFFNLIEEDLEKKEK
jgi:hypothetical protein